MTNLSLALAYILLYVQAHIQPASIVGKGSYGVVISAMDTKANCKVAIKRIKPYAGDEWEARHTLREVGRRVAHCFPIDFPPSTIFLCFYNRLSISISPLPSGPPHAAAAQAPERDIADEPLVAGRGQRAVHHHRGSWSQTVVVVESPLPARVAQLGKIRYRIQHLS